MTVHARFEVPRSRVASAGRLFLRVPVRFLSVGRLFRGGRIDDLGRLPRYAVLFLVGVTCIWVPIIAYLATAPLQFTSQQSLILPGSGASASVNLSEIGQASSFANSAYSSSSISPTVTYQRLLSAGRVLQAAAQRLGEDYRAFGRPRIRLVDQTGLILIDMIGGSPEQAQSRGAALTAAFLEELDRLRNDEQLRRQESGTSAIRDYETAVAKTRDAIIALQSKTGLVSVEQYHRMVADADQLEARLRDVEASLLQRDGSIVAMATTLGVTATDASLALRVHADPEFRAITEAMAASAAELGVAQGEYGVNHPLVVAARTAFEGAKEQLLDRVEAITGLSRQAVAQRVELLKDGERAGLLSELVRLQSEYDGLVAERHSLVKALITVRAKTMALVDTVAQLDDLNRDYQVAEAVFASAMARSNSTKSDVYASYPLVQVLEEASLPQGPSSPKKKLAIAAGVAGVLCFFMGLMLAWLRRPLIDKLTGQGEGDRLADLKAGL